MKIGGNDEEKMCNLLRAFGMHAGEKDRAG